jgi:DMSO/TMAO reductase YedYZ molybdopterin-dependent catalytic subunit
MRRRTFLSGSAAAASSAFVGCSGDANSTSTTDALTTGDTSTVEDAGIRTDLGSEPDVGADAGMIESDAAPDTGPDVEPPEVCDDPFAGGELLGTLGWPLEDNPPMETKLGTGWDGRLYTDLEKVSADSLVIPVEAFYIRTHAPPTLDQSGNWNIAVDGLVDADSLTMADLEPFIEPMGHVLMECSGNGDFSHFGLLSSCEWQGAKIQNILNLLNVDPSATRVLVSGFDNQTVQSTHSTPGAAWVFTFEQLISAGAFLATHMNGEPLTPDHGAPVRLMVPNWYGCSCIKWVDEIQFVDEDEPATTQMMEFAGRTHQSAIHGLARDYKPATMDQAAMPIRIEKWRVDGKITYKVVGIMWGGYETTEALEIQFGIGMPFVAVDVCPTQIVNTTWTVWSHQWTPNDIGQTAIRCRIADNSIPTIRLNSGFYQRVTMVDEV